MRSAPEILRVTPLAAVRLRPGAAGRVHSVFSAAINLEMAEGGLVTLHGPGPLRAPFAAACDRLVETWPGAAVRRESGALLIGGETLRLDRAHVVAASWAPALDRRTVLARLPLVEPTFALLADRARALGAAIRRADEAFEHAARALLGLGPGLTPSGDDCLVGALAALWCHGDGWRQRLGGLGSSLVAAVRDATTPVAAEFVTCALDEAFSEPVQHAVARGDAAELLAFGATSGRDTLLGIRTALVALA